MRASVGHPDWRVECWPLVADRRHTRSVTVTRWLFADQLGPHFLDDPEQPILLVESRAALARRPYHRAKRHLVMSALRHRAAELGDRVTFLQTGTYAEALAQVPGPIEVIHPTSRAALRFVRSRGIEVLPSRGFVANFEEFADWAGRGRLRQEEFYRAARRRTGLLMDGDEPAGGRWNYDAENREPPPKGRATLGAPTPWQPTEDAIDEHDLVVHAVVHRGEPHEGTLGDVCAGINSIS